MNWFNEDKGFSFRRTLAGCKDCCVHFSAIQGDGFKRLIEGEALEVEIVERQKCPAARSRRGSESQVVDRSVPESGCVTVPAEAAILDAADVTALLPSDPPKSIYARMPMPTQLPVAEPNLRSGPRDRG